MGAQEPRRVADRPPSLHAIVGRLHVGIRGQCSGVGQYDICFYHAMAKKAGPLRLPRCSWARIQREEGHDACFESRP